MAGAVTPSRKGVFSAKAKAAGQSTAAFAAAHAHDSGKLGQEARLAQTFAKMRPNAKKKGIVNSAS